MPAFPSPPCRVALALLGVVVAATSVRAQDVPEPPPAIPDAAELGERERDVLAERRPLGELGLDVAVRDPELRAFAVEQLADSPAAVALADNPLVLHASGTSRPWLLVAETWEAPGSHHQPLYFEEVNAERHGLHHGHLLQPVVSAGHFFGTIPILPYKIGAECPHEIQYTLGHYRPGACVPYQCPGLRPSWKGAALQTAATLGVVFVVP